MTLQRTASRVELWMIVKDPEAVKRVVAAAGLTHREIADACGWKSHTIVGRIVRGELRTVEPRKARLFEEALKVPNGYLFATKVTRKSGRPASSKRTKASAA